VLSVVEARVLGCLLEKERTVPDQYPLTLNALVSACNQSSSRDPVMHLDDHEVETALASLKAQGLVRMVHPSHGRSVTRYRQVFDESRSLDAPTTAVLAVLMLRGPQTVAELRTRTERLHPFGSLGDVESCLRDAAGADLVRLLERQPGHKEARWQQLVADEPEPSSRPMPEPRAVSSGESVADLRARVDELEAKVARLEAALSDLL
jgi:uncharacterized protein YceH (UPF0502 family)